VCSLARRSPARFADHLETRRGRRISGRRLLRSDTEAARARVKSAVPVRITTSPRTGVQAVEVLTRMRRYVLVRLIERIDGLHIPLEHCDLRPPPFNSQQIILLRTREPYSAK